MSKKGRPSERFSTRPPLKRNAGSRSPHVVVRAYVEGSVTERAYLRLLKDLPEYRSSTELRIVIGSTSPDPLELVERALRDSEDSSIYADEFWCIFDVEAPVPHGQLQAALKKAQRTQVKLAVSNPCFEIWLKLHKANHGAYITTADIQKDAGRLQLVKGKELSTFPYMEHRAEAGRRAEALRERHRKDGVSVPDNNPSTDMDLLIDSIDRLVTQRK